MSELDLSDDDLGAAIAFIEDSKDTHELWAVWRREHDNVSIPEAGLLKHHEKYILEYEHTLAVLRAIRIALTTMSK